MSNTLDKQSPADLRLQLEARWREAEGQFTALNARLEALRHDADELGYEDAAKEADELHPKVTAARRELDAATAALAKYETLASAAQKERDRAAEDNRLRSMADLTRRYLAAVDGAQAAAALLGEHLRSAMKIGGELAHTVGTQGAFNHFQAGMIADRAKDTMAQYLRYEGGGDANALRLGVGTQPRYALVPVGSLNVASGRLRQTFRECELAMLDAHVDFFDTAEDAEAARLRRDPTGETHHVLRRLDGIYVVKPGTRRATAVSGGVA